MNRMGSPVLQRFWCILEKARKERVRENDPNTFSFFFFLPDVFSKPVVFSLILILPSSHLCLGATCYGFFSDRACQNRDMVRPFEKCPRRAALLPNRIRRPHRVPGRELIVGCHARLLATGSVLPGRPGPKRGAPARPKRTLSTEARVLEAYRRCPEKSLRQGEKELRQNAEIVGVLVRPFCSSQRDANYTIKFVQHRRILHQRPHEKIRIITAVIKIQSSGGNSETPCTVE